MKKNWEIKKLGDICEIARGGSPRPIKEYITTDEDGINWIKIGDTDPSGKYIYTTSEKIKPAGLKKSRYVEAGDFLLSNSMSFGRPYVLQTNGCIHDGWLVLKNYQKSLYLDFFYYLLLSPNVQKQFEIEAKGSTVRNLNTEIVSNINVSYPPLEEQKRIVKILDEKFAQLEIIKAVSQTNLQNAKDLFQSKLTKAFSNTTWEKISVKNAGITLTGTTPPTSNKSNYGDYIPFIKPGDINIDSQGGLNYDNEGLSEEGYKKSRIVKAGSTLMVCIGATVGKVGFTEKDITCNQQINAIIPSEDFYPKFIYYSMINKDFQNEVLKYGKASQATLPIINKSKWENLIFSYPKSKNEQKRIVKELDTLSEKVRQLQEIYTKQIANCDELKQSLLQKAFEGEL